MAAERASLQQEETAKATTSPDRSLGPTTMTFCGTASRETSILALSTGNSSRAARPRGVPPITVHDARHTCAPRWFRTYLDEAKRVGHWVIAVLQCCTSDLLVHRSANPPEMCRTWTFREM